MAFKKSITKLTFFFFFKTVKADLVIVADGCFSKFRKDLVSASVSVCSNFVGLILHNVPQYAKGHAEIVLGNTGPILLYQISSTCTRVLIDMPQMLPSDIKKYLETMIYSQLPGTQQKINLINGLDANGYGN